MKKHTLPNSSPLKTSNSIKFLVATDVHLGHQQNHVVRKNDSFNAFQQVLSIATDEQVDFLLLGGDLFDQVNPSQKTIYKCLNMLQYYVQGQSKKDLHAKWLNNQEMKVNFENKNINIKLPIFTIHGNHDYPSNDFGKLSICDLLHVSNYANYFGKHTNLSNIQINPIIIEKQNVKTKIAIYGLGYIKDNVLNQMFEQNKVKFKELENKQDYFCLFIFHQNRYKKGLKPGAPALKCISSKHIPVWMDLTIWGHEHQAISKIQTQDDRQIFQPGSTVITSFIEAQSFPKQALFVQIPNSGDINVHPIPLKHSYRPMICRNYESSQLIKQNQNLDIYIFLDNELKRMIDEISQQFPDRKPIIRLKISKCKGLQTKYCEKVANPQSVITFWKRKQIKQKDDKQLLQAFKQKANLKDDHKQITEQILARFVKKQQNQNIYYDPRDIYKYTQHSIQKQLINSKQYLNTVLTKDIKKKSQATNKQIQLLYKNTNKQFQILKKKIISNTLNNINKKHAQQQNQIGEQSGITWEQQKNILILKQKQIKQINVYTNYGSNLLLFQQQVETQQKKMNVCNQRQSGRSTISNHDRIEKTQKTIQNNNMKQNLLNDYISKQSSSINRIPSEQETTGRKRPGILKNNNLQLQDYQMEQHHDQEDDCCKRAQKTEYNQDKTKQNFLDANNKIKLNNKNNKKNDNIKDKKKKSVRFSDEQFDN